MKSLISRLNKVVNAYPVHLRESASLTSPVRALVLFLLLMFLFTGALATLGRPPESPPALTFVYIAFFPIAVALIVLITVVFANEFLLRLVKSPRSLRMSFNIVFDLARNGLLLTVLASLTAWLLPALFGMSDAAAIAVAIPVVFVLFLADLVAHLSALCKAGWTRSLILTLLFGITFVPAFWIIGSRFVTVNLFDTEVVSQEASEAASIPQGSVVLRDRVFWRAFGLDRFSPVIYRNRGRGGRSTFGRIWGLPGERLEMAGGDIHDFETADTIIKPDELQEVLWIPVDREDFSKPSFKRGWTSLSGWVIADGALTVDCKERVFLHYSPSADTAAWRNGTGVTDLDIVSATPVLNLSGRETPIQRLTGMFFTERQRSGALVYWGRGPVRGERFCIRCGREQPPVRKDEAAATCNQCGAALRAGEDRDLPLFKIKGGDNPVFDLRLDFSLTLREKRGDLFVRFNYHDMPLKVTIDCSKGVVRIEKTTTGEIFTLPKVIRLNVPVAVSLRFYDGLAMIKVDEFSALVPGPVDLSARPPFELAFGAENTALSIDDLSLWRDQYYTASSGLYSIGTHSLVKVPDNGVFVLSDRGQSLEDSRTYGCVSRSDVIGVPVMVLWPFSTR
jgi:hypothetical protein